MKIVTFYNFTDTDFTGTWGSEPMLIKAGQSMPMEDWRAQHFAKHLANRELLAKDASGNRKFPTGDNHTSPKNPEQDVLFYDLYTKALITADAPDFNADNVGMELAQTKKPVKKTVKKTEEFEGLGDK